MPSVQQLLNDIRTRFPASTNTFTDGIVIGWMNDTQNEIWRFMASTEVYETDTVAGQAIYSMASDMRIDMIKSLQISNSTTIDGTEGYITYDYAGPEDELSGNQYYDALGQIGIYPVPSTATGSGYKIKISYEASPVQLSTDTLATIPSVNAEYQDILKWRALRDITGSGNDPNVALENNYQAKYDKIYKKIKMDYYKRKSANPRDTYSYAEGWNKG
jgi:hypothetical protein